MGNGANDANGAPGVAGMSGLSRYHVDAVAKAMRLLATFGAPPHRFSLTELSTRSGLSKNRTFRLLQTLAKTGFVCHEPDTKLYRLGLAVFGLAGALRAGDELLLAAGEALDWACDASGETVNLFAPDGEDGAICVDKRESDRHLQISARIGARFALHAGASPKLLLACAGDAFVARYLERHQPLRAFTSATIVAPGRLWEEVRRIRAQGFSVSDEDLDRGACAIAAPVRDRRGAVVAGVSVAAPATRFGPAERERTRAIAVEAGQRISRNLGYRMVTAQGMP